MGISNRIEGTIENWSQKWKDRLRGWLVIVLSFGFEAFMDVLGKSFAPKLSPLIESIEAKTTIPEELKPILDEIRKPTGQVGALLANSAGGALVGGAIGKVLDFILRPFIIGLSYVPGFMILDPPQLLALWLRGYISDKYLSDHLHWLGFGDDDIEQLKELSHTRLTPETVMRLWVRDKTEYEELWKDLEDIGVSKDRIKHFKELAWAVPTPSDVINFAAKEAFEDEMAGIYGLDDEYDAIDQTWMDKAGVKEEARPLYWRSHWIHPALGTVFDLLHRKQITDEEMYRYYRLVEIPPYWRDKLTEISWDLPNRIELRMMARYGLVDKDFLIEQLGLVGLKEEYRDVAADMMLAMGIRTDLSTRFSKGWITPDKVKSELEVSGLSPEVQERMYQWIVKNMGEERVTPEKDLTKSEIYTGVKKEVISWTQGLELLQDLGYDSKEAEFILDIRVGAMEGSPETYQEFKKITQLYKQSQGLEANIPSQDLIQAEKDVLEAEKTLGQVQTKERTDITEAEANRALEDAKIRYHQLKKS